ncbi:MAG: hypothetical protein WA057_03780 [Candidatus Magasanikiibacteriota bacterium]
MRVVAWFVAMLIVDVVMWFIATHFFGETPKMAIFISFMSSVIGTLLAVMVYSGFAAGSSLSGKPTTFSTRKIFLLVLFTIAIVFYGILLMAEGLR